MAKYEQGTTRSSRESRGRPSRITKEKIVDVAMTLAPQSLNMAKLAEALNVRPPTLYYHISGIDELRALMVERISWDLWLPEACADWQQWLLLYGEEYRRWLLDDPIRLYLVEIVGPVALPAANLIAAGLEQLRQLGLPEQIAIQAFFMVSQFVQDFVGREYEYQRQPESYTAITSQMQQLTGNIVQGNDIYNTLLGSMNNLNFDDFFHFQLQILADGLNCYWQRMQAEQH